MNKDVTTIELHGPFEENALLKAIQKRMDVLGNGYSREDVIEFLSLQQIMVRMTQVDPEPPAYDEGDGDPYLAFSVVPVEASET